MHHEDPFDVRIGVEPTQLGVEQGGGAIRILRQSQHGVTALVLTLAQALTGIELLP